MSAELLNYDNIGKNYCLYRQPDPRLAQAILMALGDTQKIVNVGAGTGSYEPSDRTVVAVEPSSEMIRQRRNSSASVVVAQAESLPFTDGAFDAALAVLSIHHWSDWQAGLREMRRVARDRVVLLTCDLDRADFWLVRDYFPDILESDRQIFPTISAIESVLGKIEVQELPIPHDCLDGFLGAYWRRPSAYLNAVVRSSISAFWRIGEISSGIDRLQADIESGSWALANADILKLEQLDLGYRLVIHRIEN